MKWKIFSAGFLCGIALMALLPFTTGEIDYRRVAHGKKPLFARIHAAASDGGTIWYKGVGYELYSYHSFVHEDPTKCTVGPSITYSMPFSLIEDRQETKQEPC